MNYFTGFEFDFSGRRKKFRGVFRAHGNDEVDDVDDDDDHGRAAVVFLFRIGPNDLSF